MSRSFEKLTEDEKQILKEYRKVKKQAANRYLLRKPIIYYSFSYY